MAFAGWTVYSHLYSKDSLMEAFYKISGGKDKFEKLPEILLKKDSNEKISEAIRKLDWDKLEHPIAKTKTLDGRNVIIIKGLTRNNEVATCQTKGILAFVERLGPNDVPRVISNVHELADSIMHAICPPFTGNTFSIKLYSSFSSTDHHQTSSCCKIFSFISAQMANEFFAQMK